MSVEFGWACAKFLYCAKTLADNEKSLAMLLCGTTSYFIYMFRIYLCIYLSCSHFYVNTFFTKILLQFNHACIFVFFSVIFCFYFIISVLIYFCLNKTYFKIVCFQERERPNSIRHSICKTPFDSGIVYNSRERTYTFYKTR